MWVMRTIFLVWLQILALSGCVVSGGGVEEMVDHGIVTSSIVPAPASQSPDQLSDQRTVRNAVSAADIHAPAAQPIAWANADTGASGVVTAIQEVRAGDVICRQFRTSRQRFDGVALYNGEACTKGEGEWTLTHFSEGS